jgi:hypothetical protein
MLIGNAESREAGAAKLMELAMRFSTLDRRLAELC